MESGNVVGGDSTTVGGPNVRIVVVGDPGTGKTSLIKRFGSGNFPEGFDVACLAPPVVVHAADSPYGVPYTIVDTSSRDKYKKLKQASAVVITYACDRRETFDRVFSFWLLELVKLRLFVPTLVVGCKSDLREDDKHEWEYVKYRQERLMKFYLNVESAFECSAKNNQDVNCVFLFALRGICFPSKPLIDIDGKTISCRLVRALKRVFTICDKDKDGALSDTEYNFIQYMCDAPEMDSKCMEEVKKDITNTFPDGVNPDGGIKLPGFLFLHVEYIKTHRLEATWSVVRSFGYDEDLKYREDVVRPIFEQDPDQSVVELGDEVRKFLKGVFIKFDSRLVKALSPKDVDFLFSTELCSEVHYKDEVPWNAAGDLLLDGFLSMWELMAFREPAKTYTILINMGYLGSIFPITSGRRSKMHPHRSVYRAFVFGAQKAGKSALLDKFIRRKFSKMYTSTTTECFAANVVRQKNQTTKTLILQEIPEHGVPNVLSNKESFAACDVAIFVYDSFDKTSSLRAMELSVDVAIHGKNNGFEVPFLFVATLKDPDEVRLQFKLVDILGEEIISSDGKPIDIFLTAVKAADDPHSYIPNESHLANIQVQICYMRRHIGVENWDQDLCSSSTS